VRLRVRTGAASDIRAASGRFPLVPDFLTDEWFATVREIRNRYAQDAPPVPYKIRLNQVITDVPFGEGERRLHIDTSDGAMVMEVGELEDPDATLTTDYETAKKLLVEQDQAAAMQAFMAGKIKIQGDMTKLMAMQGSPASDVAKQIAEEIKGITT
jgi:hypothetical protein